MMWFIQNSLLKINIIVATSFFFLLFAKFCSYKDTQDLRTKVP